MCDEHLDIGPVFEINGEIVPPEDFHLFVTAMHGKTFDETSEEGSGDNGTKHIAMLGKCYLLRKHLDELEMEIQVTEEDPTDKHMRFQPARKMALQRTREQLAAARRVVFDYLSAGTKIPNADDDPN